MIFLDQIIFSGKKQLNVGGALQWLPRYKEAEEGLCLLVFALASSSSLLLHFCPHLLSPAFPCGLKARGSPGTLQALSARLGQLRAPPHRWSSFLTLSVYSYSYCRILTEDSLMKSLVHIHPSNSVLLENPH